MNGFVFARPVALALRGEDFTVEGGTATREDLGLTLEVVEPSEEIEERS